MKALNTVAAGFMVALLTFLSPLAAAICIAALVMGPAAPLWRGALLGFVAVVFLVAGAGFCYIVGKAIDQYEESRR